MERKIASFQSPAAGGEGGLVSKGQLPPPTIRRVSGVHRRREGATHGNSTVGSDGHPETGPAVL